MNKQTEDWTFRPEDGVRMRQMGQDLQAEKFDNERDNEFFTPFGRFINRSDVEALADLLEGTDDSIVMGMSQLGIDPRQFNYEDRRAIRQQLKRLGLVSTEEGWVRRPWND